MLRFFIKQFSSTFSILLLGASSLIAQKADHLSMKLYFEDSTVYISAQYQSAALVDIDSIYFLLNPEFKLDTIKAKGLKSYAIVQKEGIPLPFYYLSFNGETARREKLNIEFKYQIDLSNQNHMKSNWIELNADKLWAPNLNSLNNKFTYDLSITDLPESYFLSTHSDAKVIKKGNVISIKKDTPWFEVLILAGKSMKESKFDQNITIIGEKSVPDSTLKSISLKVKNSIDLLNNYFGEADPISTFNVILRNTERAEIGFQFNRHNMIITGVEFDDYANLSHEIAHYWWSKANFIKEPWINESFANFSMLSVLRKYEPELYEKLIRRFNEKAQNTVAIVNAELFEPNAYNAFYYKGALHLLKLEEQIGAEMMQKLLTVCIEKKVSTCEEFLNTVEQLTSKEQRDAFLTLLKS